MLILMLLMLSIDNDEDEDEDNHDTGDEGKDVVAIDRIND